MSYYEQTDSSSELPSYGVSDANKVLKIDSNGVFLQWLQETSELPIQTGNANKILTTNGTTATWTDAPTLTVINSSTGATGGIKFGSGTGVDGSATGINLRIGGTTVVGVSSSTVTSTGVINITHAGSMANPSLSFGDRVAGSLSGIYANPTDDTIGISTNSTERLKITNATTTVSNNLNVTGNINPASNIIMTGNVNNYLQMPNGSDVKWPGLNTYCDVSGYIDTSNVNSSYIRFTMPIDANTVGVHAQFNMNNSYFWKPIWNSKAPIMPYTLMNSVGTLYIDRTSPPIIIAKGLASSGQDIKISFPDITTLYDGMVYRVICRSKFSSGGNVYIRFEFDLAVLLDGTTPTVYGNTTDIPINAGHVYDIYAVNGTPKEYYIIRVA